MSWPEHVITRGEGVLQAIHKCQILSSELNSGFYSFTLFPFFF